MSINIFRLVLFVFFLGKEVALGASLSTGFMAIFMELFIINHGQIDGEHITTSIFHGLSILLCGFVAYNFEKYRKISETKLIETKNELDQLLEKKANEEKLIAAKEEAIRANKKLKNKQEQLDDILKNSPGVVFQFSSEANGKYIFNYVSDQALNIFEVTPDELIKCPSLLNMVHKDDIDSLDQLIIDSANKEVTFQWTGRIVSNQQKIKHVSMRSIPRKDNNHSVTWSGVLLDISKEKEMEAALVQQQRLVETSSRLASLGEITAGIAHEINNPLAIIVLKLDDLKEHCSKEQPLNSEMHTSLDHIDEAVERISKIIDSLRYLSKERGIKKDEKCNIYDEVRKSLNLIKELYRHKGIKISDNLNDSKILVSCPKTYIHQIFINLASNAKDAISNCPDPAIDICISKQGNSVCLSIEDNGPGIPKEIKDKIFDPFFTTKGTNKGTGIGLSMCFSMIQEINGKIHCESNQNGSKFKCFFNIANDELEQHAKVPETDTKKTKITEKKSITKALVIDDEPIFLDILAETLSSIGYEVTASSSGPNGLEILMKNQFEVIISDQKMPIMTGTELFKEIMTNDLSANAIKIMMSGHVDAETEGFLKNKEELGIDAVIKKPFRMSSLLSLLNDISDKK